MQIGCTHKDHKMGFKEGDDEEEEEEINQSNSFLFQLTTKLQLHTTFNCAERKDHRYRHIKRCYYCYKNLLLQY